MWQAGRRSAGRRTGRWARKEGRIQSAVGCQAPGEPREWGPGLLEGLGHREHIFRNKPRFPFFITDLGMPLFPRWPPLHCSAGRYEGHFSDRGFNAIQTVYAANSWVKNVKVENADTAVFSFFTDFSTFTGR